MQGEFRPVMIASRFTLFDRLLVLLFWMTAPEDCALDTFALGMPILPIWLMLPSWLTLPRLLILSIALNALKLCALSSADTGIRSIAWLQ